MKILSIIIPAYNAHKTIKQTISSITYQNYDLSNIEVILVNDNPKDNYDLEYNFYKNYIDIKVINNKKNLGPGLSRNEGIKESNSKYLMFIDADDVLRNPNVINTLIEYIDTNNADYLVSPISIEINKKYYKLKNSEIMLHGKVYRRDFIIDNNIEFPSLPIHEDGAFNDLVLLNKPKRIDYAEEVYLYREISSSIMRKDKDVYKKTFKEYILNTIEALDKAKESHCDSYDISLTAFNCLSYCYFGYVYYKLNYKELTNNLKGIMKHIDRIKEVDKKSIINKQFREFEDVLSMGDILNSNISFDTFMEDCK